MTEIVVETVTFNLNEGADKNSFITAAKDMSEWLSAQPGFIRRRLSCADDETWIDHLEWTNMDAAMSAASAIGDTPANGDFLHAIDMTSAKMTHSILTVSVN